MVKGNTMRILLMDWKAFGNQDVEECFKAMGDKVCKVPVEDKNPSPEIGGERLEALLADGDADFVFSFNYFPAISIACQKRELSYVSWIYDSPHIQVYSYTVINPCNYVFLFDYAVYEELHKEGIQTVYYLPLGVNEKRLERELIMPKEERDFTNDIAFVGSMYSEEKHRLYDKFKGLPEYVKGYLDGLMKCQQRVYGYYFLQELLQDSIIDEMEKIYPTNPDDPSVLSPRAIYADYVLARQVTAWDRKESLEQLGRNHTVALYTHEKGVRIPGVINCGKVDYYKEMPAVFAKSRINLNITLRSIKTGIPLRALDIMACGGFLLTNYQSELMEYFIPGEDFVYYDDMEDLCQKVDYYLRHEEERQRIARNGCIKVRTEHTMTLRLQTILEILKEDR